MQKFQYPLPEPPYLFPRFDEMTLTDAESHFAWFVSIAHDRVELLRRAFVAAHHDSPALDETPESLRPLWNWLRYHVAFDAEPPAQSLPAWAAAAGVTNRALAPGTLALAVDTGFYMATVFQRLSSSVRWTLWTTSRDYFHYRPVLEGFGRYPLVPHDLVVANCWRQLAGQASPDGLLRSFNEWRKRLPPGRP